MEPPSVLEIVRTIISAGTLVTVVLAYKSYSANLTKQNEDRDRDRDKELLAQAQKSLRWAYEALTDDGKTLPPEPDRLKWLTAARHLLRAEKLAGQLVGQTYRTVYDENEEFWRLQFYKALDDSTLHDPNYFRHRERSFSPPRIAASSALVVLHFSTWKKGAQDPADSIDRERLEADLKDVFGARGLIRYLDTMDNGVRIREVGE